MKIKFTIHWTLMVWNKPLYRLAYTTDSSFWYFYFQILFLQFLLNQIVCFTYFWNMQPLGNVFYAAKKTNKFNNFYIKIRHILLPFCYVEFKRLFVLFVFLFKTHSCDLRFFVIFFAGNRMGFAYAVNKTNFYKIIKIRTLYHHCCKFHHLIYQQKIGQKKRKILIVNVYSYS